MALAACAALPPAPPEDASQELAEVPFFPQTLHQCGPAALATVLGWSGGATIPGRRGSLALELAAAARRAGRIPYELPPTPAALLDELGAGAPVLVLQDLGIAGWRAWHFAVLIGYDPGQDVFILRSGTERRRLERRERFLRSWDRAGNWALVTLPPQRLPASLAPENVVRTVEAAAPFMPAGAAGAAYAEALLRWPRDPLLLLAAANEAYAATRLEQAEAWYRRLLDLAPDDVVGRNNLASLLLDRGCPAAAAGQARLALDSLQRDPARNAQHRGAVEDTLARALGAGHDGTPAGACGPGPGVAAGER